MKTSRYFLILILLIGISFRSEAKDTLNLKEKLILNIESQIEKHIKDNKSNICTISFTEFAKKYLPPHPIDCNDGKFIEQVKYNDINNNCYFTSYSNIKPIYHRSASGATLNLAVAPVNTPNLDVIDKKIENLNKLEFVKKYARVQFILISEIPIALVFEIQSNQSFSDVYLKMNNEGARGMLKKTDENLVLQVQNKISSLVSTAINNIKVKINNPSNSSFNQSFSNNLQFISFETIHKYFNGDEFNTEQSCFYTLQTQPAALNLTTEPNNLISFQNIFTRLQSEVLKKPEFNQNEFNLRLWISAMPEILEKTYNAYDKLNNAISALSAWQNYEALFTYLTADNTPRGNVGSFYCPNYYAESNIILTMGTIVKKHYFGVEDDNENKPNTVAWKSLADLPVEAFQLLGDEKTIKLLQIISGYSSSIGNNTLSDNDKNLSSEYQRTIVNIFKYFATLDKTKRLNFLTKLAATNPVTKQQALIYDLYWRITDKHNQWVYTEGMERLETTMQLTKVIGGTLYESNFIDSMTVATNMSPTQQQQVYQDKHVILYNSMSNGLSASDIGTSIISDYVFNKNGSISFKSKVITGLTYTENTMTDANITQTTYYNNPTYSERQFSSTNPFELIDFTAANGLVYGFESNENYKSESARGGFVVPAIALQYCISRELDLARIQQIRIALDLLCIATIPFTGGWSAAGIGGRLLIIGVYAQGASVTLDLASITNNDQKKWILELKGYADEIAKLSLVGNLGVGGLQATQRGLVKLAQHLTDQGKTNLATALRKFHSHYGQSMANASYLFSSNAEQITYLKQMGQLYRYCDDLLPQISNAGAVSGEVTGFYVNINNSGVFIKGKNTGGEEVFYMMTKSGNTLIKTEAIGTSNGGLKVKTAFEDIPEGEVSSLQLIKHSPNDAKHITTTGELTDEAIIAGIKKDGSAFICEGKIVNGKRINNCFAKGTLVSTKNGLVPIENIKEGDNVPTYNEKNNNIELSKVTELSNRQVSKLIKIISSQMDTILVTPEHPFWTSQGKWVQAKNLTIQSKLIDADNQEISILFKKELDTAAKVYNFEVQNTHTYLITNSKLIVHNNCGEAYAKGLNRVLGKPNVAVLKQKLFEIDQFLLNGANATANEALGLAFSAMHPTRLATLLTNQNFINNYFKGAANTTAANSSWLKDFNYLQTKLAGSTDAAETYAYFVEARAHTATAGTLADYDVSKYPDWLLWQIKNDTKNFYPLPAYKSAANIAPYVVTKNANSSLKLLNDWEHRTKIATFIAEEMAILKSTFGVDKLVKHSETVLNFAAKGGAVTEVSGITYLKNAAAEVAKVESGVLNPTLFTYNHYTNKPPLNPIGNNASSIGKMNGYEIFKDGNTFAVKRVPDESGFTASELNELKSHPDAHTLYKHGDDVTELACRRRATELPSISPDGVSTSNKPPYASKFETKFQIKKALSNTRPGTAAFATADFTNPTYTRKTVTHELLDGTSYGIGIPRDGSTFEVLKKVTAYYEKNATTGIWQLVSMFPDK